MNVELVALLITGLMTYITIFWQPSNMSASHGASYSVSNRDTLIEKTPLAGRLQLPQCNEQIR